MIKNVFFDYNGTLINFEECEKKALELTGCAFKRLITPDEITIYQRINSDLWEQYNKGNISRDTVLIERFKQFFQEINFEANSFSFNKCYLDKLKDLFVLEPHVTDTLELLSQKYNIFVVTNGVQNLVTHTLYDAKISCFIKDVFTSERAGAHKPSKDFFNYCLNSISAIPEECLIVGDSITSDIKGGKDSGIYTCLYNRKKSDNYTNITPDVEIQDLADLEFAIYSIV